MPGARPFDPTLIHKEMAKSSIAFMKCKDPTSIEVLKGCFFERVRWIE